MNPLWFDAHLDLGCLAVNGRDLTRPPRAAGGPWQPAAVTLSSLAEGHVACALGTIFTEPDGKDAEAYPAGDAEAAHKKGRAQLEVYETLRDRGHIALDLHRALRHDSTVGRIRAGMGVAEVISPDPMQRFLHPSRAPGEARPTFPRPLTLGVLIEGADPVRTPEELPWWVERGVVAVGLAWWRPSRYSGGNGSPGVGISDLGREMVRTIDALGVVHDASHLSDKALGELFSLTDRPIIASHSNCRAITDPTGANERHLADEAIREIGRRAGVVGVNLVSNFLDPAATREPPRRARFEFIVQHIERICDLMGRREGVGLGSDMDGGFSAEWLPEGMSGPADFHRITDALAQRGWSPAELDGFRFNNWAGFFQRAFA